MAKGKGKGKPTAAAPSTSPPATPAVPTEQQRTRSRRPDRITLIVGDRVKCGRSYPSRVKMPSSGAWAGLEPVWKAGVLLGLAAHHVEEATGDGLMAIAIAVNRVPLNMAAPESAARLRDAASQYVKELLGVNVDVRSEREDRGEVNPPPEDDVIPFPPLTEPVKVDEQPAAAVATGGEDTQPGFALEGE